jgi:hypothetical protein
MFVNTARISTMSLQNLNGPQAEPKPERVPLSSNTGDGMDAPGTVKSLGAIVGFVGGLFAQHYLDELIFNDSNRPAPKPGDGGQGASGNSGTGQGGASGSGTGGATGMATNTGGTQGSSGAGGAGGSK